MISPWKSGSWNPSTMSWTGPIAMLSPLRRTAEGGDTCRAEPDMPALGALRPRARRTSPRCDEGTTAPGSDRRAGRTAARCRVGQRSPSDEHDGRLAPDRILGQLLLQVTPGHLERDGP